MWSNIQSLMSLANLIQWISIGMIFFGGLLQVGKFFVDNKISAMKEVANIQKELLREETEDELNSQVDSLKLNLNESKEEIDELRKKTKYVNPYTQPIQSGSATILVKIKTNEKFNSNFMNSGGYVGFGLGSQELLILRGSQCSAKSINTEEAVFQGVFNLSATHKNIGKELTFLKEAEFLQIQFHPMKKNYQVVDGSVFLTFNGNARIEFKVPPQMMVDNQIYLRNIKAVLDNTLK